MSMYATDLCTFSVYLFVCVCVCVCVCTYERLNTCTFNFLVNVRFLHFALLGRSLDCRRTSHHYVADGDRLGADHRHDSSCGLSFDLCASSYSSSY